MKSLKTNFLLNKNISNGYMFTKQENRSNIEKNSIEILKRYFASIKVLSSKEVFTVTRDKVIITAFYYSLDNTSINENTINNLGLLLSKIYNRPVELQLIKLLYPYLDRNILAQFVSLQTRKYNFRKIKRLLFKNIPLSYTNTDDVSKIVGIKIIISGRLTTERARPRKTVSMAKMGTFRQLDKKMLMDYSSHTFKNAHGAFTVKIWINQIP